AVRRQIDALAWHAMSYHGRLAFPGEQMMRLSMDLSTGTAGCLLAPRVRARRPVRRSAVPHRGPYRGLHEPVPPGTVKEAPVVVTKG
ncbi:hypothetical protein E4N64_34805, partial [Streptomyces sp. MNU103]|nr:hypothetical protein [Streptomyces sp. MNU103]